MANKKVSQLTSKPAVNLTDLFLIADPTSGQAFKTTISDLGTAIGSGVSSVNGLVGAVVLDTDDIQELASPTNRWFTDTRARAALSAASPLAYNSGTGVFSLPQANGSTNGFLSSADWTTFNAKQAALSGTGFVKISGTTISYDNSTYLTTSAAASTYLALAGGTLTGALNGTSATFTGDLTLSATNPRLYFTDTDNNPDYFISNTDGTFTIYDVTNSTSRFTIGTTGNGTFGGNLTVGQIIRSGGTSSQFLKADGSVDSTSYQPILTNPVTGTGTSGIVAKFSGTSAITDSIIYDNGTRVSIGANITTTNTFTSVSSTSSAYAVVAQASSSANGIWSNVLGTGEIFRGQTAGGSYFIINNGGNAFLNGNLNVGDFASTSFRLNVVGTANITGALTGTSATFSGDVTINNGLADGGQLVLASSGFSNWNIDNFSGRFRAYYGSTEYFTINASGNVGIGTTGNASRTLEVAQPSGYSAGIRIIGNTGGDAKIQFLASGASSQPDIGPTTASPNDLIFGTGGSERMRIASNGDIYVGSGAALFFGASTATYLSASTSVMTFAVNNAERMRITSGGSIQIGTTTGSNPRVLIYDNRSNSSSTSEAALHVRQDGTNAIQTWSYLGSEVARVTSGGNVLIGTTSDSGGKLQVAGNTYTEGVYVATGQFSQGGSATSTFYTFSNLNTNRVFLITLRQSGSSANNVVAMGYTYGGVLAAYNIVQDNTNPALFLTITSTGGLGLRLTTGSGYGTTTWEYTITQIK